MMMIIKSNQSDDCFILVLLLFVYMIHSHLQTTAHTHTHNLPTSMSLCIEVAISLQREQKELTQCSQTVYLASKGQKPELQHSLCNTGLLVTLKVCRH